MLRLRSALYIGVLGLLLYGVIGVPGTTLASQNNATFTLTPASGASGSVVTAAGTNWNKSGTVNFSVTAGNCVITPTSTTTNSSGAFSVSMTITSSSTTACTIHASQTGGQNGNIALDATFTPTSSASVSVAPNSGNPGATPTVSGSGFKSGGETVALSLICGTQTSSLGNATANSSGGFSQVVTIPSNAYAGSCTVQAAGQSSGITVTTPYTVVCPSGQHSNGTSCLSMVIGQVGLRFSTGGPLSGVVKGVSIRQVQITGAPFGASPFKVVYTVGKPRTLFATGKGTLYRYLPAAGSWHAVSSIHASGIYAIRQGAASDVSSRPADSTSSASSGSGPSRAALLAGLVLLLVLGLGGFGVLRRSATR